jgi:hypothetical protein
MDRYQHAFVARGLNPFLFYMQVLSKHISDIERRIAHACDLCHGVACSMCREKCLTVEPPVLVRLLAARLPLLFYKFSSVVIVGLSDEIAPLTSKIYAVFF